MLLYSAFSSRSGVMIRPRIASLSRSGSPEHLKDCLSNLWRLLQVHSQKLRLAERLSDWIQKAGNNVRLISISKEFRRDLGISNFETSPRCVELTWRLLLKSCLRCLWSVWKKQRKPPGLAFESKQSKYCHLKDTKTEQKRGEHSKVRGAPNKHVTSVHDVIPSDRVCVFSRLQMGLVRLVRLRFQRACDFSHQMGGSKVRVPLVIIHF